MSTDTRRVGRTADALGRFLTRAWSLPPRRNRVTIEVRVPVPMSDGTVLLADHYAPVTGGPAPTVLVRCPYGRGFPFSTAMAQLVAERGYHVLLQSCRGTFGSGGEFEPMRNEIADGRDTMAWLREQAWFSGRLATYGASYLGFVQWALAMDPPPELVAAVVQVAPHDFSRSAYRNGAFDLYNFLEWSDLMAHQEQVRGWRGLARNASAPRRLHPALDRMPVTAGARDMFGSKAPWFESWLEHPDTTGPFWEPLRCGAALDRLSVPTLLVGGWHDLFIEQTLEQYHALNDRGVTTRLVIGPWTHADAARAGAVVAESLRWLDRYLGERPSAAVEKDPVRVHVGHGGWRDLPAWPPPDARQQRWNLGPGQTLAREPAGQPAREPARDQGTGKHSDASFRYDPHDPTPSAGGAIMAPTAGVQDNRDLEQRPDVLVYTSAPLGQPAEILGDVVAELSVIRDNPHADLFVRLCDVDPRGRSRNVCDGIVRLTGRDPLAGPVRVSLLGAAHRFGAGHRIRLQVCGGAHPRFARNPGNGQVESPPSEFVPTRYRIGEGSFLLLGGTAS